VSILVVGHNLEYLDRIADILLVAITGMVVTCRLVRTIIGVKPELSAYATVAYIGRNIAAAGYFPV
jgi:hypothetical protein